MISNYLVLDTGMHGEAIATATVEKPQDTILSISKKMQTITYWWKIWPKN